jgi:predicted small secreted protein
MFKHLLLITAALFTFGLGGCNTIDGIGKDIKKAGESIEDAATKKK